MTEATNNQRPSFERMSQWLGEMADCEGEMCSHCIDLLTEKLIPELELTKKAVLRGMTFEPDGAQFILRGPIRFEVKNKQLVNIDPINFEPVGPIIARGPHVCFEIGCPHDKS